MVSPFAQSSEELEKGARAKGFLLIARKAAQARGWAWRSRDFSDRSEHA